MLKQKEIQRSHKGDVYDVVVIGAGISGMACSYLLTKGGLNVLLVDSARETKNKAFFSEVLSSHGQILMDDLFGAHLSSDLGGVRLGRSICKWNSTCISLKNHVDSVKPLALDKNSFNEVVKIYIKNSGVHMRLDTYVVGFNHNSDILRMQVVSNGQKEEIWSRLVVIASGRKGRRMINRESSYKPDSISCGFVVPIDSNEDFYIEGTGSFGEWWYTLPINERSTFVCVSIPNELFKKYKNHIQLIKTLYKNTKLLKTVLSEIEIPQDIVYRWGGSHIWESVVGKSWVCIGDAAYVHHPLSGRGMDFGFFSARLLTKEILNSDRATSFLNYKASIENHIRLQSENEKYWSGL